MEFRTDMALERNEMYKQQNKLQQIDGVEIENDRRNDVEISRIKILSETGEKALNKPIGNYITLDVKKIKLADEERLEEIAKIVADELRDTIGEHEKNTDDIMIVGLGNLYVTPDALGPKVVPEIEVTRHILEYMPKAMPEDTRPVSAISPGVLGITGIETMEILKGVVDNVKPKLLIVIDALASRSIDRISSSIQIADTGIVPGAGVENKRKEISKKTKISEIYIAKKMLELAQQELKTTEQKETQEQDTHQINNTQAEIPKKAHIGYYLIDKGINELYKKLEYTNKKEKTPQTKTKIYITSIIVGTVLLSMILSYMLNIKIRNTAIAIISFILFLIPSSEVIIQIAQTILNKTVKPKLIPK